MQVSDLEQGDPGDRCERQPAAPEPERTEILAARVRASGRDGFDELYRRFAPAVYAWATLHLRPPLAASIDPEDVLQEVACRAYEGFDSYDPARGDYRAWVFGIARNVLYQAMDRLRARADVGAPSRSLSELPDTATSITARVARNEEVVALLAAVADLPDADRRLLLYRGLEGLSHQRVAELMGLSVDAVMQRWSRLRSRLGESGWLASFLAA